MITLTEAAVDAACLALNDGVRSTLYRDRWESLVRHALEAALPHLTDDGATNTPPAVPSGVGAPQAPGATGEAAERASGAGNTVAAPSSPHLVAEDIETTGFYYCEIAGEIEAYNHGGFDVCCDKPHLHLPLTRRAWDAIGAMAADQAGDGAAPAIDRDDIQDAIYKALPGEITWHESLAAADAVLSLIEGAS